MKLFLTIVYIWIITLTLIFDEAPLVKYLLYINTYYTFIVKNILIHFHFIPVDHDPYTDEDLLHGQHHTRDLHTPQGHSHWNLENKNIEVHHESMTINVKGSILLTKKQSKIRNHMLAKLNYFNYTVFFIEFPFSGD